MGAVAAAYCLEREGPQNHIFSRAEFVARYRRHFEDGGILDELITGELGQGIRDSG
jgi:hypothetical protein